MQTHEYFAYHGAILDAVTLHNLTEPIHSPHDSTQLGIPMAQTYECRRPGGANAHIHSIQYQPHVRLVEKQRGPGGCAAARVSDSELGCGLMADGNEYFAYHGAVLDADVGAVRYGRC